MVDRSGDIDMLEEALAVVQQVARFETKCDVVLAKKWLREQGPAGGKLATMLAKLSSARNKRAHPLLPLWFPFVFIN